MKKSMKHFLFIIAAIGLLLTGCKTNQLLNLNQKIEIIGMNKSACFGYCPRYEFKVYNDRSISFNGLSDTNADGYHTAILGKDEFNKLVKKFNKANLHLLADNHIDTSIADAQITTYYYANGEYAKTITRNIKIPAGMEPLENDLIDIIKRHGWLK